MLKEIPGIAPARMYPGCTRNAYHLYMFRYDKTRFAGLPRATFLKAMAAEGVPCSGGYSPLNTQPFLKNALHSRGYQRMYSAAGDCGMGGAEPVSGERPACARRRCG